MSKQHWAVRTRLDRFHWRNKKQIRKSSKKESNNLKCTKLRQIYQPPLQFCVNHKTEFNTESETFNRIGRSDNA